MNSQQKAQLKDSTYSRSTISAPRASSLTTGGGLRKSGPPAGTPAKSKTSSSVKTSLKSSTTRGVESTPRNKTSKSSSNRPKPAENKRQTSIASVPEESDSSGRLRPYGEIPRSNTFTKEDTLSDLLTSQGQESLTDIKSLEPDNDNELEYEDDFEAS